VVGRTTAGEDGGVVDEAIVWMVPLVKGGAEEHRGTLTLEDGEVVFTDRRATDRVSIPVTDIKKAKRVRGSPILVLTLGEGSSRREVAFYFAPPPPLKGQTPLRPKIAPFGGVRDTDRTTKKVMRTNVSYLHQANASLKAEIEGWLRAIREAGGR
jgi:hypothetical protein